MNEVFILRVLYVGMSDKSHPWLCSHFSFAICIHYLETSLVRAIDRILMKLLLRP